MDQIGNLSDEDRQVSASIFQSRSMHAHEHFGRRVFGVALAEDAVAFAGWSWDEERWEVRYSDDTNADFPSSMLLDDLSFPEDSDGFPRERSPWSTHVRGVSFDHQGDTEMHSQFAVSTGDGELRAYSLDDLDLFESLGSFLSSSYPAWVERGPAEFSWVNSPPHWNDTFTRYNYFDEETMNPAHQQRYAVPVDTTRPLMSLQSIDEDGQPVPGMPEVLYHTYGVGHPTGIVIGRRDMKNVGDAYPFGPDHRAAHCFFEPSLLP